MKKVILIIAAALMVTSANAQRKHSGTMAQPFRPEVQVIKPQAEMKEAQQRVPGTPAVKAPKQANDVTLWYNRPAGAFPASFVVENGAYGGYFFAPYLAVTPYTYYTFTPKGEGHGPDATYEWDVNDWGIGDDGEEGFLWKTCPGYGLTYRWGIGVFDVPILYLMDGDNFYEWQYHGYEMGGNPQNPVITKEYPAHILSVPSTMDIWGYDILKSSKTFIHGGRHGGNYFYLMTYYSGVVPWGENVNGWWFGKNAGTSSGNRIDGIAQAFEKPAAPYRLNQVVLDAASLAVAAPVDMTCKVYKLDEIPAYNDSVPVTLPDEPGELIAKGRANLTPETNETTGGLIFFTLYAEEYGLEYDIAPTIDCPILVVIDGYNEPEMANLRDFTAMISTDMHTDEGFGELAYLKYGFMDDNGNLDHYVWTGLNHFFSGDDNEMMTGLTIFLSTENPYLTFRNDAETGKYLFPEEGGITDIEFMSSEPSADDGWLVSGGVYGDDIPDWLTIELTDVEEDGEFTGFVNAEVTAEPLPEGISGRSGVVRFEFSGAYLDYKFIQKREHKPVNGYDVNGDGSVNIADIDLLIHYILTDRIDDNICPICLVNEIIDYILSH